MDRPDAAAQRLADALRARAVGGGHAPTARSAPNRSSTKPAAAPQRAALRRQVVVALLAALLVGLAIGAALAGLSVLFPGLLPPLG